MILRGRKWWRLGAALLLPASVGVVLSPVAAGDASGAQVTTQALATQSTYYWREQVQATNVGGTNVAPPTGALTDPTVPAGDVAVAGPEVNGQTDKETYLEFDVSAVPAGSTITSFVVSLPVDPSSQAQNFTPVGTAPPIIACTPQGAWSGGAQSGQSFAGKPTDQCATDAPKFTSKDGKTYTADIASVAQGWLTGVNTGVAVADDPSNTQTAYQVVFGPSQAVTQLTAQMTYVPGAANTTLNTPGESTAAPSETIPSETVNVPLVPSGGASSVQAPSTTTPAATVPSGPRRSSLRNTAFAGAAPPGVFWVAAVLVLALLLSASLVLGDEPAEEPLRGRRRLLLQGTRQHHGDGPGTSSKEG